MDPTGFLAAPAPTPEAQSLFDEDVSELGFVMNSSRLWAHQPATAAALFALMQQTLADQGLTFRHRGVLVTACASALGDSYCSLAWGCRLADETDPHTASEVLQGRDEALTPAERALASWARKIARTPNDTTPADVQTLRDAGWTDSQIFAITTFVALRIALSTVNDALGARPDAAFRTQAPRPVLAAVTYGRPIADPDAPPPL